MRVAIVGGTGREGKGLGVRWARAGHDVLIGSRDEERARTRAHELAGATGVSVVGGSNEWAVREAEVAVLAVPYGAHAETLRPLAQALEGRILVDITVPLVPPRVQLVKLPAGEAAALEAQAIVGPRVKVVAALHHVSSALLADPGKALESDVLVCGDDEAAKEITMRLLGDLGAHVLDAGPLANAVALESLTPVLLYMSKRYKRPHIGIRVTGIDGM